MAVGYTVLAQNALRGKSDKINSVTRGVQKGRSLIYMDIIDVIDIVSLVSTICH